MRRVHSQPRPSGTRTRVPHCMRRRPVHVQMTKLEMTNNITALHGAWQVPLQSTLRSNYIKAQNVVKMQEAAAREQEAAARVTLTRRMTVTTPT